MHRPICECDMRLYVIEAKKLIVVADPDVEAKEGDLVVVPLSTGGARIEMYIGQKHDGVITKNYVETEMAKPKRPRKERNPFPKWLAA